MAKDRPVYEIFQTPTCVLKYPWVNTPDVRYNKEGIFQTKASIAFDRAQDLIAQMERIRDAEFAKLDPQKAATYSKKDVYDIEYTQPPADATDEEKDAFVPEPTDNVEFKAKLNAVVHPKEGDPFKQTVILIDADEAPITDAIWSGTTAQLRGQVVPWVNAAAKQVGVTLRLRAVKVIDLVTGEGSTWGNFD